MNRHMTTWTARIVAAVAALAAVTGVATADADSADDQFVAALNAHGVPGNRGAEIGIDIHCVRPCVRCAHGCLTSSFVTVMGHNILA